jgi:hypothetical protein
VNRSVQIENEPLFTSYLESVTQNSLNMSHTGIKKEGSSFGTDLNNSRTMKKHKRASWATEAKKVDDNSF